MSYHPAIGHLRGQLPRIAFIAALFAATGVLLGLHQREAALPSDAWYQVSRQRVLEGDVMWRLGDALHRLGRRSDVDTREQARRMREQAVARWERLVLVERPNHAAAYRLGVVYGHRGYSSQAVDMLALAAGLDEERSDYYHALAEVYAAELLSEMEARRKAALIAEQEDWTVDIALADTFRRIEDEEMLRRVMARKETRSMRFAAGFLSLAFAVGMLLGLGLVTLAIVIIRWGFTVRKPSASLPLLVPWTIIDVAEAVAVLLFTLVVGGMVTSMTVGRFLPEAHTLTQPIIMTVQYLLVGIVTIAVIFHRMGHLSSHPLRALGMRFQRAAALIGIGLAGYSVLLTGLLVILAVLGRVVGDVSPLAQTIEQVIGEARTPGEIAIYFVLVVILAPIVEELVFRGYVYAGLRRVMATRHAIIIGAALFAAVHLNAAGFLMIGIIGVMLCYLYERSRSLLPCMVAHGVHNALVLAVMLLQAA